MGRKCTILRRLLFGVACLPLLAGTAVAGKIAQYSADMVSMDATGHVESTTRIKVADGNIRLDVPAQEGMAGMVIIVRPDLKLQWMLDAETKTCLEQALNEEQLRMLVPSMAAAMDGVKEEILGSEVVQGYKAEKKRLTITQKGMGQVVQSVSTVWQAEEFDFPLRERDEEGFTEELRNIRVGKQAAEMFEVPAGYRMVKGKVGQMPLGMVPQGVMPEGMQIPSEMMPAGKMPSGMMQHGTIPGK